MERNIVVQPTEEPIVVLAKGTEKTEEVVISPEQLADEKRQIRSAYRSLIRTCQPIMRSGDNVIIRQAFELADKAHAGVRRKSGEPYILHPLAVAQIVAEEVGLGTTSVVCALLHDVVEDTEYTLEDIERAFNKNTARIVDGLTKIKGVTKRSGDYVAQQSENLKKILLTLSDDVRVILVKIADRLHNMRTMKSMPEHKQVRIASETFYLYAPLAHRLGLYAIKTELEDLSLKYSNPLRYKEIASKLAQTKRDRDKFIKDFVGPLEDLLKERGLDNFQVVGRPKSINSIWNKIRTKNVTFEEIYDLFAIRIIIDCPQEEEKELCWKVYSIISDLYRPIVERLRDWISNPKSNGYESLHTTVMGPEGKPVEVQIRAKRMDEIAEKGLAAHWKYKGGVSSGGELDRWLEQVRGLLQHTEEGDAMELISDFKHSFYERELYVFTPKGDLKVMRGGATILDFAFEIHTAVGKQCVGGKINGKLFPISYKLSNGDQVEILTAKKQSPSKDWLEIAVTSKARSSIKGLLKEEKRRIAEDGQMMFERKLKSLFKTSSSNELVVQLVAFFKQEDTLNFFYNIATGNFDLKQLKNITIIGNKVQNLAEPRAAKGHQQITESDFDVNSDVDLMLFGGLDNVDYTISPCCSPKPGDQVFGFITINNGIKIHRDVCPNAANLRERYPYRIVKTKWAQETESPAFLTGINIKGIDHLGLVNKITDIISKKIGMNIRSISFTTEDNVFDGRLTVFVNSNADLNRLMKDLRAANGVHKVTKFEA